MTVIRIFCNNEIRIMCEITMRKGGRGTTMSFQRRSNDCFQNEAHSFSVSFPLLYKDLSGVRAVIRFRQKI